MQSFIANIATLDLQHRRFNGDLTMACGTLWKNAGKKLPVERPTMQGVVGRLGPCDGLDEDWDKFRLSSPPPWSLYQNVDSEVTIANYGTNDINSVFFRRFRSNIVYDSEGVPEIYSDTAPSSPLSTFGDDESVSSGAWSDYGELDEEPRQMIARYSYPGHGEGLLPMTKGMHLEIVDERDPDWWIVMDIESGRRGIVPSNHLQ